MWFKTRVGLTHIDGPMEVLAYKYPKAPGWCVYAKVKECPEGEGHSLFGKIKMTGPILTLACFNDGRDVQQKIAATMSAIATAIGAQLPLCELSEAGDAEAWDRAWTQIAWLQS